MNNKMIFKFPDSDVKKIIIENWTDEPIDNLLGYINTSEEEKRINHSSSKILVFKFENFMV